jgi:tryptophan 2,3-dioxygenase
VVQGAAARIRSRAALLEDDEPHRAQHTLKRILTILKVMVAQLDILETMTPLEFISFRQRLEAASGFSRISSGRSSSCSA